jgi:YD repeat-containing protein
MRSPFFQALLMRFLRSAQYTSARISIFVLLTFFIISGTHADTLNVIVTGETSTESGVRHHTYIVNKGNLPNNSTIWVDRYENGILTSHNTEWIQTDGAGGLQYYLDFHGYGMWSNEGYYLSTVYKTVAVIWKARDTGAVLGAVTDTTNWRVDSSGVQYDDVDHSTTTQVVINAQGGLSLEPGAWAMNDMKVGGEYAKCGMATYSSDAMQAGLAIEDMPLTYEPAFGPALNFRVSYSQVDDRQVLTSQQSSMGPNWTCNWFAWIDAIPASSVQVFGPGGGEETYQTYNSTTQAFTGNRRGGAVVQTLNGGGFERQFSDGSAEVYATTTPATGNRFFLSSVRDAWGNVLQLNYGSNGGDLRLESITDATGKVTTFQYAGNIRLQLTGVSDPFGRQVSFSYDANGRFQSITDPVGIVSTVTYLANENFVNTLTTPYGNSQFSYGYFVNAADGSNEGRWLEMVDPRGGKERVEYRSGAVAVGTDPAGPRTYFWSKSAYALDQPAGPNAPVYAHAQTTYWMVDSFAGLANGLPYSVKRPLEGPVVYSYQSSLGANPPATTVGGDALLTQTERTLDDGTIQIVKIPTYNSLGRPTSTVDALGRSSGMNYAANGIDLQTVTQTNGANNDVLVTFNNYLNHLPQTIVDGANQSTSIVYNGRGQVQTITDAEGKVTKFVYQEDNTQPEFAKILTVTAGFGSATPATTTYAYDAYGRISTVTDPEGYTVTLAYDAVLSGNALSTLDRVVRVTYPDSTYEETRYDGTDGVNSNLWPLNVGHTRDRLGRETTYQYDSTGKVIKVTDPENRVIQFTRCLCGAIATLTDANGSITEWVRDIQMRVVSKAINSAVVFTTVYENSTSRVKTVTDAMEQVTNYQYYLDNSLKRVSYTGEVSLVALSTPEVNFTYDPIYPRLASMTDITGITNYTYWPAGALGAGKVNTITGPLANSTFTYTYDSMGRVSNRTLGGAGTDNSIGYVFNDPLGRLKTITNPLGQFTVGYDNGISSRVATVQSATGFKVRNSWEPAGDRRLTGIQYQDGAGNPLASFGYGFAFPDAQNDPTGQIRQWTQWQRNLGGDPTTQGKNWNFRYDKVNQLKEAVDVDAASGTPQASFNYGYDPAGNRTNILQNGSATQFAVNPKNQFTGSVGSPVVPLRLAGTTSSASTVTLAGQAATMSADGLSWEAHLTLAPGTFSLELDAKETTPPAGAPAETTRRHVNLTIAAGSSWVFTYDNNGSLISTTIGGNPDLSSCEWDAANRLSAIVKNGNRTEFTYDGLSRRVRIVEKTGTATTGAITSDRAFVWEGFSIAEIRDQISGAVTHVFGNGEVRTASVAQTLASGTGYFYLRDHLGSVREMVAASDFTMHALYDFRSLRAAHETWR